MLWLDEALAGRRDHPNLRLMPAKGDRRLFCQLSHVVLVGEEGLN